MECTQISFSDHAVTQMFKREISVADIKIVIANGEIIITYADDKPFPSYLLLAWIGKRPLHALVAQDISFGSCIVVTAYEPDTEIWESDFKNRRQ